MLGEIKNSSAPSLGRTPFAEEGLGFPFPLKVRDGEVFRELKLWRSLQLNR